MASNQIVSQFVYGSNADHARLYGERRRHLSHLFRSVRQPTAGGEYRLTGAIAEQIDYDEFGNVLKRHESRLPALRLCWRVVRSRYEARCALAPAITTRAPAAGRRRIRSGLTGGDTNLYGYVLRIPINRMTSRGYAEYVRTNLRIVRGKYGVSGGPGRSCLCPEGCNEGWLFENFGPDASKRACFICDAPPPVPPHAPWDTTLAISR